MEQIASKKQVLQFINDCHYAQPWEVANEFGYTLKGAIAKIHRLRVAGLVTNSIYGKWNLTNEGERRLDYYNAHQKKGRSPKQST